MTNGTLWRSRLMSDYWFGQLPAALQDALLGAARQRRITPGKLLFAQGDPPCGLYVLLEGAVRMGSAGQQRLTPRLEELVAPFWFGEVSLFDGQPRTLDAYSLVQSIFLQVPQPFIDQWLLEHPEDLRFLPSCSVTSSACHCCARKNCTACRIAPASPGGCYCSAKATGN